MKCQTEKEQQEILKNYNNSIVTGIIAGLMGYCIIFVYNQILERLSFISPFNIITAFLGGVLIFMILYWFFVTRPIKEQELIWAAKELKTSKSKK